MRSDMRLVLFLFDNRILFIYFFTTKCLVNWVTASIIEPPKKLYLQTLKNVVLPLGGKIRLYYLGDNILVRLDLLEVSSI